MRWLRALALRLGAPFTGGRHDREFRAELQSHLQMHIDDNLRAVQLVGPSHQSVVSRELVLSWARVGAGARVAAHFL